LIKPISYNSQLKISQNNLDISYANKLISKAYNKTFLEIYLDSTMSLKIHTEQITYKLNAAYCAVWPVKPFISHETLKMVYYGYFYSIMNCGLIILGNSSLGPQTFF
jgi:hypothetical protein